MNKTILITGANAGLGKEVARQLALLPATEKIYLACRNEQRALAAKQELERRTGKAIFEIVRLDVASPASARAAVAALPTPVDALVMNAGGPGGKAPLALTAEGGTQVFADNLLGHVVLLEELLRENKLRHVALYVGSEAARGVSKLGIKPPTLPTSSVADFVSVANGRYFAGRKPNSSQAYGQVKYMGALWMAALARQYPTLRFLTVSPGNTAGTQIAADAPWLLRLLLKYFLQPILMPLLGIVHKLPVGARRLVDSLTDDSLRNGAFYASAQQALTGPLVDQSTFFPDLNNTAYQANADQAIHHFISAPLATAAR